MKIIIPIFIIIVFGLFLLGKYDPHATISEEEWAEKVTDTKS